jgi:hypothetical protein
MKTAVYFVPQFFLFFVSRISYILFYLRRKLMRTKNWVVFGVVSAMTLGMLTGCQSKETAAETEAAQETDNGSEVAADAAENEAVEELPFAEANGLQFSDLSPLELPGVMYFTDENGNYAEDVSLVQLTAVYTFGDITVSEPDEDGKVVYTIPVSAKLLNPNDKNGDYQIEGFGLMDWYTGAVFSASEALNDGDNAMCSSGIVRDDVTYSVYYTLGVQLNSEAGRQTYRVTVPEDYDGLVIFIDNRGRTEYQERDIFASEDGHIFGEKEDESFDDYTFIRVSDYAIPEDN